jgi:hypothetical protein
MTETPPLYSTEFRWPFRNPRDLVEELFAACLWSDKFPIEAAHKAASWLFSELRQRIGSDEAQRAFLHYGKPLSKRHIKQIKNENLLTRYDLMRDDDGKPSPNVQRLAQQIVDENDAFNKSPERNGEARPTNLTSIDKHIRRLLDLRTARRARAEARQLAAQGKVSQLRRKKKAALKSPTSAKPRQPKRKSTRR